MSQALELASCRPLPVERGKFNDAAVIPYGLTTDHVFRAMSEFAEFLGFINEQLVGRSLPRLETIMMPANFSSLVGEFISAAVPKHCKGLVKNLYHNGHPDLVPAGVYHGDAVLHCDQGIEVKGSRFAKAWQGHNREDVWLMVFVFDSNRPKDAAEGVLPRPFRFSLVALGRLEKADWKFAGRSETSRRTITASVTPGGMTKMLANWVYRDADAPAVPRRAKKR